MDFLREKSHYADDGIDEQDSGSNCDALRLPGQRDPERTKRAIIEAAIAEFVEKGFAGASVNEIAARANVNKRMLYHYYGKKEDLYIEVLEHTYAKLRSSQTKLKLKDIEPYQAIETLIRFTWDHYLKNPEFVTLLISENMLDGRYLQRSDRIRDLHPSLFEMIEDVIRRGESTGIFRQGVDSLQLYLSIASQCFYYLSGRVTLSIIYGRDLDGEENMQIALQHVIDVIQGYLRPVSNTKN